MKKMLSVALVGALLAGVVRAEAVPVKSSIASLGLFKNGLAVVTRSFSVPGPGTYLVADVPDPVHGTFWIESDAVVETRATMQETEVPVEAVRATDLPTDLAGKEVLILFREPDTPPVKGQVIRPVSPTGSEAWSRSYERYGSYYDPFGYSSRPVQAPQNRFLIVRTAEGLVYVDPSTVSYVRAAGEARTVTRRRPVLLFEVKELKKTPATVVVTYLAKGMAWAPAYRVDISDPTTLSIAQSAVLKNELERLEDADVYLISGFPSMEFSHVSSPLSLRSTWADFFTQLSRQPAASAQALSSIITQQAVSPRSEPSLTELGMSAIPTGEGPDLHYQSIGKRSLAEGDSLSVAVASGKATYERLVEWLIPDTRDEWGRYIQDYERQQNPDRYKDAAWDAVRFKNPLPFAMTTAPAMFVADGRFLGQRTSFWANAGELVTLHITKALSIRTRAVEYEEPAGRDIVYHGSLECRKVPVRGELSVNNHRNEKVTLVIRRRFSGDLVSADSQPKCVLLEQGVYSLNKRNELVWSVELEPGAEQNLSYRYTVLVRNR